MTGGRPFPVSVVRYMAFVDAVTSERRATGGWFVPCEVARELGISRASAYRYINHMEAVGILFDRDPNLGHRCRKVLSVRGPDLHQGDRQPMQNDRTAFHAAIDRRRASKFQRGACPLVEGRLR